MFIRYITTGTLVLFAFSVIVIADERDSARAQVEFGIEVAEKGLWREAIYRWERAVSIDKTYAEAWNNLGIAYELKGRFNESRDAYEKAMDLDPGNFMIQQNYDLFREINDRINEID